MDSVKAELDALMETAAESVVPADRAESLMKRLGWNSADFQNELALHVARRFMAGSVEFWDADAAINSLWAVMIEEAAESGDGFVLAEPAYAIYTAFDAGEFDHGDGQDPIEAYTKPELTKILATHGTEEIDTALS